MPSKIVIYLSPFKLYYCNQLADIEHEAISLQYYEGAFSSISIMYDGLPTLIR